MNLGQSPTEAAPDHHLLQACSVRRHNPERGFILLSNSKLMATLPASDMARAKAFYADKLDLKPVEDGEFEAWYETGGTRFLLYMSGFAGTNQATAAGFVVDDVETSVAELKGRGVVFEEYDFDELKTVDGIATTEDGTKAAWFKDSEGNIISIASTG